MNSKPLVSVLMCAYNALPYIKSAYDSIRAQTYQNWELLICDDGSTDGTLEFINRIDNPRVKIFFNKTNKGYLKTKNKLHRAAQGEFITQLDADDLYAPHKLELQIKAAISHQALVVGCGYACIDTHSRTTSTHSLPQDQFLDQPLIKAHQLPFWFPSLLIHRSVFDDIGLFDEYFSGTFGDDLYWTIRASEKYRLYCISYTGYFYRYTPGSITNLADNRRKLIVMAVVQALMSQRDALGTDWLEQKNYQQLQKLEASLFNDKDLMHHSLLTYASKHIDHSELRNAAVMLLAASKYRPASIRALRASFYFFRKLLKIVLANLSRAISSPIQ